MSATAAPLSGVRVLDMGWSWAGPYAGMILADLGAEVIKLESLARIDVLRRSAPFADEIADHERGGYYTACNRGKLSASLNLKHPDARELVLQLVEISDVVIENFAPRVLPQLGLGTDAMLGRCPRSIVLSMSGYGANGPEQDYLSYGDHLLHASGFAAITGAEADPDTKVGTFYGDPVGGMYGALAILMALEERERTGRGQRLELSQLEGLVSLIGEPLLRTSLGDVVPRSADKSTTMCPHGFYRCEGIDAWVAIAVRDDDDWHAFTQLLRAADIDPPDALHVADRLLLSDEIDAMVMAWVSNRSPWQVVDACQGAGVPAYPVQSARQLLWDEHLAARRFFAYVHHPVVGPSPLPGVTFRIGGEGARVRSPAPLLGEHNKYVFQHLLGMPDDVYAAACNERLIY
jgi:benzylsuccinate CoA-transferase BbsF subunit